MSQSVANESYSQENNYNVLNKWNRGQASQQGGTNRSFVPGPGSGERAQSSVKARAKKTKAMWERLPHLKTFICPVQYGGGSVMLWASEKRFAKHKINFQSSEILYKIYGVS
ncbi:hypothetical protein ILYODFUR_001907 [Ilyodon furcidens]|uniref:Uncharacterized protein n=1 Tax=Ilyodon furcidens TaxID=33524 RepID=A0ABV0UCM4_9TELE